MIKIGYLAGNIELITSDRQIARTGSNMQICLIYDSATIDRVCFTK